MDLSLLNDAELWEKVAAKSSDIASVARHQFSIAKGWVEPEMRAQLIASDMAELATLQAEYDDYCAELKRRLSARC